MLFDIEVKNRFCSGVLAVEAKDMNEAISLVKNMNFLIIRANPREFENFLLSKIIHNEKEK